MRLQIPVPDWIMWILAAAGDLEAIKAADIWGSPPRLKPTCKAGCANFFQQKSPAVKNMKGDAQ